MNYDIIEQNILKHTEYLNENAEDFVKSIPFYILERYLEAELGLDDLKFNFEIKKTDKYGTYGRSDRVLSNISVSFETDDIKIKDKLLSNLVKSIKICSNAESIITEYIKIDEKWENPGFDFTKVGDLSLYFSIDLRYIHHDKGRNGHLLAKALYKNDEWQIVMAKDLD